MATLEIVPDQHAESPRDWDNVGTMACWHRRYHLGDEQPGEAPDEWRESLDRDAIVLPLYLYEHSGIAMNTTGYACPWDSGQVGWIYYAKATGIEECYSVEQAEKYLKLEVRTYSEYLEGSVYGFRLVDDDGEEIDSCWGFYGYDPQTNGMAESIDPQYQHLLDSPEYV